MDRPPGPRPLNPYGHSGPVNVDHQWSHEYLTAAFERARNKVANAMMEAPVGPDPAYRAYAWLNLGIGLLWLAAIAAVAGSTKGGFVGGCIWPIIFIAGSSYWFTWYKNSNPDRPERAVQAWVGAIMRRKWERVDRLRLHTDRDGFPRRLPEGEGAVELPMSTIYDVEQYWGEYRRRAGLSRGRWKLKKPNVRPLNASMALVEAELTAPRFPQWIALVFLAGIVAGIIGIFVVVAGMKKTPEWIAILPLAMLLLLVPMLVVVGWRLLSGEWQAPEDRDLRWMQ